MDLRIIRYFLAVAREQSFAAAAYSLCVTQPTLSRQIQDLEFELGKTLIDRSGRKIELTEEGMIFRKRAQEILDLVEKTKSEVADTSRNVVGDVFIGAGETYDFLQVARAVKNVNKKHPEVRFHIESGDSRDTLENLQKGLLDFILIFGSFDTERYHSLELKHKTSWGILMDKKNPLSRKKYLTVQDVQKIPLIVSRQMAKYEGMEDFFGIPFRDLNIIGSCNLIYNASLLVQAGFGSVLGIDGIVNTAGTSLVFRPFKVQPKVKISLIWKKYQVLTKAAEAFLKAMRKECIAD